MPNCSAPNRLRREYPFLNFNNGALSHQGRPAPAPGGGTVRMMPSHGAMHALGPISRGVDIIQNCEVDSFRIENGTCLGGRNLARLYRRGAKVGVAVCRQFQPHDGQGGMRPAPSNPTTASPFVSDRADETCAARCHHFRPGAFLFCSQSDKGLSGLCARYRHGYNSYAQPATCRFGRRLAEGRMALFPGLGRVRLLRMWGGIMDMSMDGSPIIDRTHIDGLYFNGGCAYGGSRPPQLLAGAIAIWLATRYPHQPRPPYRFDRFERAG